MQVETMGKRSASDMSSNGDDAEGEAMVSARLSEGAAAGTCTNPPIILTSHDDSQDIDTTLEPRASLLTLLSRPSPFANETGALPIGEFEPVSFSKFTTTADLPEASALSSARVLVVGAGESILYMCAIACYCVIYKGVHSHSSLFSTRWIGM
jgi:hypothetical protein